MAGMKNEEIYVASFVVAHVHCANALRAHTFHNINALHLLCPILFHHLDDVTGWLLVHGDQSAVILN